MKAILFLFHFITFALASYSFDTVILAYMYTLLLEFLNLTN